MSKQPLIFQNRKIKTFRSEEYNYTFDLRSGNFRRWGKRPENDPIWSSFGPEILDIEISSGAGCPMTCSACYKGNKAGSTPTNMSFATFKNIFDKLPHTTTNKGEKIFFTTQIAFGITSVNSHPELFEIFDYCRQYSVIPNVTINGMDNLSDQTVQRLVDTCGAIAVSINKTNFHSGLNLVERMTKRGASQINIHYVISLQTINYAYDVLDAIKHDPRLQRLNAIVFLGLKPKNRGAAYDILPTSNYITLINYCLDRKINFGFDSCSSPRFEKAVNISTLLSNERKKSLITCSERCESGIFSAYIDCHGIYWPCSFGENDGKSNGGIDTTKVNNFVQDVWHSNQANEWRKTLFLSKRECPLYPEIHSDK